MLAPGTVLQSRYRVVRRLGEGGMATVYLAVDERFSSPVALKIAIVDHAELRKAFEREARLLNKLRHPALPVVIDFFSTETEDILVMDFVEGDDLAAMLARNRGPFPVADVMRWADRLLDALEYLHAHEPPIVHRDIKPQNLKLTSKGEMMLLDFGISKGLHSETGALSGGRSLFAYTASYAPFEQIRGFGTSPRSDLFSLAVTLYYLLTSVLPPDALARADAAVRGAPDPLRLVHVVNPAVPQSIGEIVHRAMAQSPEGRPASASEMRTALRTAWDSARLEAPSTANAEVATGGEGPVATVVEELPVSTVKEDVATVSTTPMRVPAATTGKGSKLVASAAAATGLVVMLGLVLAGAAFKILPGRRSPSPETTPPTNSAVSTNTANTNLTTDTSTNSASANTSSGSAATVLDARTLGTSDNQVGSIAVAPDGKSVATGGWDKTVRVWDLGSGSSHVVGRFTNTVWGMTYAPDGASLVVGTNDQSGNPAIERCDLATGQHRTIGSKLYLNDRSLLGRGPTVLTVDVKDVVQTLDLQTGQRRQLKRFPALNSVAASRDGATVAITTSKWKGDTVVGSYLVIFEVATGTSRTLGVCDEKAGSGTAVDYSPDSGAVVTGGSDGTIRLWGLGTGQPRILGTIGKSISRVVFSPDGKQVAVGSFESKTTQVWDVATGSAKALVTLPGTNGLAIAFTPDSKYVIAACADNTVRVFTLGE